MCSASQFVRKICLFDGVIMTELQVTPRIWKFLFVKLFCTQYRVEWREAPISRLSKVLVGPCS